MDTINKNETFHNFRLWLEYNSSFEPGRAEELVSRLRTIEQILSDFNHDIYRDNSVRDFYNKFSKIIGPREKREPDIKKILDDYEELFQSVSKKKKPFIGITDKLRDEYKAALRNYLLFLSAMTSLFSDDDVYERCVSKRRRKKEEPASPVSASIFKSGIFTAMRKAKCVFPGKDSNMVTMTLDKLHELMDYYVELQKDQNALGGKHDNLKLYSFMTEDLSYTFDWKAIMVDAMDIRANGELLPISDCEWALVTNKGLTLGADGSSIKYDLPDFTFTKFNTKSLSCLTTFQGSVTEQQYCCKRIVDAIYEPNLWIKKLYDSINGKDLPPHVIKNKLSERENSIYALVKELTTLLKEYASKFSVELILE